MNDERYAAMERLGEQLVACDRGCNGIFYNQTKGVLPRFMVVERRDPSATGCVMVGLNPNFHMAREIAFCRERGGTYRSVVEFFNEYKSTHAYYVRLRKFADALSLAGSILWTGLAKCQNVARLQGLPPLQTVRTCSDLYLRRELQIVPWDWLLVGVGRESYKALAYLYPYRAVLGIPHPLDLPRPISKRLNPWQELFDGPALAPAIHEAALVAMTTCTAR
ncbi:MAG: hypothetical protein ACRD1B_11250, partial [Thermoanaerobaculia bacterium]